MTVQGIPELKAALDKMVGKVNEASLRIITRSQAVAEAAVKAQFTGHHKKGEPTTSKSGKPPDVVTGTLRRSVISERPTMNGLVAHGRVYPTMVYARIQELGGRGLPARPYVHPGYLASLPAISKISTEEWGIATGH